jgi:hypothetical protein
VPCLECTHLEKSKVVILLAFIPGSPSNILFFNILTEKQLSVFYCRMWVYSNALLGYCILSLHHSAWCRASVSSETICHQNVILYWLVFISKQDGD